MSQTAAAPAPEKKPEETNRLDSVMVEQLLKDTKDVKQLLESMKRDRDLSTAAAPPSPETLRELDFADESSRSVYETLTSTLARTQTEYARGQARGVALESHQRGLEDITLDTQVLATRLEEDWFINDQRYEHLMKTKHGGVGMWLGRHIRFVVLAIILGIFGGILLWRYTAPGSLDGVVAYFGNLDTGHQLLWIGGVFSVVILAIVYIWKRDRGAKPRTIGTV